MPGRPLSSGIPNVSRNKTCTGISSQPSIESQTLTGSIGLEGCYSPSISRIERFVGDLNPEAVIREKVDAPGSAHLRDKVGLWINTPSEQHHGGNCDKNFDQVSARADPSVHDPEAQSVAAILNRRYCSASMACNRLPLSTLSPLKAIFFSRLNHILPLVDLEAFKHESARGTISVFLERAICLVAAKDQAAGPHLRLAEKGPLVAVRSFCSEMYSGLVCAMESGLEKDRVTRIRILALMSLHPEACEGAEAASMHLCQAIHQAQTMGLHLERPNRVPGDALTKLFWCLWTMDKMHACLGGRPVLLADRDIGIKRHEGTASRPKSAFCAWLALSDLLSSVISFYRPSSNDTTGWESAYPSFEEIVGDGFQEDVDRATLGGLSFSHTIHTDLLLTLTHHARCIGTLLSRHQYSVLQAQAFSLYPWLWTFTNSSRSRGRPDRLPCIL